MFPSAGAAARGHPRSHCAERLQQEPRDWWSTVRLDLLFTYMTPWVVGLHSTDSTLQILLCSTHHTVYSIRFCHAQLTTLSVLFHSILLCSILFYTHPQITSHSVRFYSNLLYYILLMLSSSHVLFCSILFYSTLFYSILLCSDHYTFCSILLYYILFWFYSFAQLITLSVIFYYYALFTTSSTISYSILFYSAHHTVYSILIYSVLCALLF